MLPVEHITPYYINVDAQLCVCHKALAAYIVADTQTMRHLVSDIPEPHCNNGWGEHFLLNLLLEAFCSQHSSCFHAVAILGWQIEIYSMTYIFQEMSFARELIGFYHIPGNEFR